MHHHAAADWVNCAANLAIVAGYIVVPFTVLRTFPMTRPVLAAGIGFFLLCALTHLSMAFGVDHRHPLMLAVHIVQAGCVWGFVLGLARLIAAARARATPE